MKQDIKCSILMALLIPLSLLGGFSMTENPPFGNRFTVGAAITEEEIQLQAILKKTASYCDKLKKAAFRFICREDIAQDLLVEDLHFQYKLDRTTWLYDYQITYLNEAIKENRTLLRKKREKMNQPNANLETRFRSFFSYYLPATLFSAEKQAGYSYRLEGWEKMKKRKVARIQILAIDPKSDLASGQAWVDAEDGAVIKISLDQRSLKGIETLEKKARESNAHLALTDNHRYDVMRKGIRFPSKTEIFEYYIRGSKQVNVSRTYVSYSDYRFFSISVHTEEVIHNEGRGN